MPNRWKRTILYGGYLLLLTLPLLEMSVRIWGYSERHIYDPIYTSFDLSEDIPYIHKPNLLQARARGLAVINTDSLGMRAKTSGMIYAPSNPRNIALPLSGIPTRLGKASPILKTHSRKYWKIFSISNNRRWL